MDFEIICHHIALIDFLSFDILIEFDIAICIFN